MKNSTLHDADNPIAMSGKLQPGDAFVAICDWNGIVKWLSNHSIKTQVGDLGWSNMVPCDAERFKDAFARTASLHERHMLEIESLNGLRYRIWLWSVGNPDLAVCTFNLLIPDEIKKLSDREREFMEYLAHGNYDEANRSGHGDKPEHGPRPHAKDQIKTGLGNSPGSRFVCRTVLP
ncbi:MAG: hypothetical protein R3C03_12400 [Pirellulaceae bacterium]